MIRILFDDGTRNEYERVANWIHARKVGVNGEVLAHDSITIDGAERTIARGEAVMFIDQNNGWNIGCVLPWEDDWNLFMNDLDKQDGVEYDEV